MPTNIPLKKFLSLNILDKNRNYQILAQGQNKLFITGTSLMNFIYNNRFDTC